MFLLHKLNFSMIIQGSDHSIPKKYQETTSSRPVHQNVNDDTKDWLQVTHLQACVPVTRLAIRGNLDGNTYEAVIAKGHELKDMNVNYLLVDLSEVTVLSNAGLVALHNLSRLINGEQPTNTNDGWNALHEMQADCQSGLQQCVKLLSPQPSVVRALEQSGLNQLFEIYEHLNSALEVFSQI